MPARITSTSRDPSFGPFWDHEIPRRPVFRTSTVCPAVSKSRQAPDFSNRQHSPVSRPGWVSYRKAKRAGSGRIQLQLTIADWLYETGQTHHPIANVLYYEQQTDEAKERRQFHCESNTQVPRLF
jgi:hypothetical protein